jgi:hypothetical protein
VCGDANCTPEFQQALVRLLSPDPKFDMVLKDLEALPVLLMSPHDSTAFTSSKQPEHQVLDSIKRHNTYTKGRSSAAFFNAADV